MSLIRQQPMDEMELLRNRMNRFLEESGRSASSEESAPRVWMPAVDVMENDQEIVLRAELPGLKKEDIDIQLSGDTLTLRGERQHEATQRGETFHRIERRYGAFQRTFQIEVPIDARQVSASYEEGVLTVRLPKQESVKPRQIAIDVQ